jgi:hypothetical protein
MKMSKTSKKRNIDQSTPIADIYPLGDGRYALNARNGIACTLTGAHHYAVNITHPRQGFREMGVLEIIEYEQNDRCTDNGDAR